MRISLSIGANAARTRWATRTDFLPFSKHARNSTQIKQLYLFLLIKQKFGSRRSCLRIFGVCKLFVSQHTATLILTTSNHQRKCTEYPQTARCAGASSPKITSRTKPGSII